VVPKVVIKRDGKRVKFGKNKIKKVLLKAASSVGELNRELIEEITNKVISKLNKEELSVEEIQDKIEEVLVSEGLYKIAKAFILYREERARARRLEASLGVKNDLKLKVSPLIVLAQRYLLRDKDRRVIETPKQLFTRVSSAIARVEERYGKSEKEIRRLKRNFYNLMINGIFLPNSPTLFNAGTPLSQLSACFVLPIEDSIDSIFFTLWRAARIFKSGGGVGYNFSNLRPRNDVVGSTGGISSGPVSFMKIFDSATEQIKQGGKRRGANMGILDYNHPDILDFITVKSEGKLNNFNISVMVNDKFMKAVRGRRTVQLINPRTKMPVKEISARAIFDLIITEAWKTGDPGLLFFDTINNSVSNCVPKFGPIRSTNPCGEKPLYSFESCNLGSINLSKFVTNGEFNWKEFERVIRLSVRFLDNVIDANKYPFKEIEEMSRRMRRIGLGIMGLADTLVLLGIQYDSQNALDFANKVSKFLTEKAREESIRIGEEKGSFPEFKDSIWYKKFKLKALRNSGVTCIAPTGTISILAGCNPSIEPFFSLVTRRNLEESLGATLIDINQLFINYSLKENFYSDELIKKISTKWSIQEIEGIPKEVKRLFKTAHDISPEWHVKMQATFQANIDSSVSKTVNLPNNATPHDIEEIYFLAWRLGCKGITVFRDGCLGRQVFTLCPECEI